MKTGDVVLMAGMAGAAYFGFRWLQKRKVAAAVKSASAGVENFYAQDGTVYDYNVDQSMGDMAEALQRQEELKQTLGWKDATADDLINARTRR